MSTNVEDSPTVAGICRERADRLEEKAEKLADSEAARKAEELYAYGWRYWVQDNQAFGGLTHHQVACVVDGHRRIGKGCAKRAHASLREYVGDDAMRWLRVLTYYRGSTTDPEGVTSSGFSWITSARPSLIDE